jgi:hypothetical protein
VFPEVADDDVVDKAEEQASEDREVSRREEEAGRDPGRDSFYWKMKRSF